MMLPRRTIVVDGADAPRAAGGRRVWLGEHPLVLSGARPRVGQRLEAEFSVPPARSTNTPLDSKALTRGIVVLSTLPNIRANACHVQIAGLEEMLPRYLPKARLCHVSSDGVDAWCEVDEYHPDLRACAYTLDGVDSATHDAFRAAFGVGVERYTRIAHGLFLLVEGIFRLVHIPRQQLGPARVSAFLRRASRIVSALDAERSIQPGGAA